MKHFLLVLRRKIPPVARNGLLLCVFLLIGGSLSVLMGQDACFDLLNYHLYNPFAFLHHREAVDLIPAGMHTFFNPLLDIPYYLLFAALNDFPRLTAFLQGLWYGMFLFAGWKICALLWPNFSSATDKLGRFSVFILGCTGTAIISQVGTSTNEIPLAAGTLVICWLILMQARSARPRPAVWAAASLLTGALFGLKYTFGPAAVGLTFKNHTAQDEVIFTVPSFRQMVNNKYAAVHQAEQNIFNVLRCFGHPKLIRIKLAPCPYLYRAKVLNFLPCHFLLQNKCNSPANFRTQNGISIQQKFRLSAFEKVRPRQKDIVRPLRTI